MFAKPFWAVLPLAATMLAAPALAQEEPPTMSSEVLGSYVIPEINQGIGVDAEHFYAIDNTTIAKYTKDTQERVAMKDYEDIGAIHFDSAAVVDGKIYVAHSNYPIWPMTSSLEIFDAATLDHLESHSFGIQIGSFTWVDQAPDGSWWGGFANYNRVFDKSPIAYGNKYNTQVVKFDADWQVEQAYVIPDVVVEKFDDMSNSGGSWGPDGHLYLSGHDPAEAYVMDIPAIGSTLKWIGTVPLEIAGQGIAWDRSQPDVIYGFVRETNTVTVNKVDLTSLK
ncbi:hypothetical protein GCM10007913_06670 [Devosia yakushimensis]|uniref:Cycloisomerase n=1 Tax=Devosia yakushimensis TaxID=470028 RepID=A0ABQ5UAG3_9HYPH|nr:cycloisomerase [Devosia yakushimensis]GLQ08735.1 hypothetical protein GCM10007913_06670 [Devosia yakushimensis]